MSRRVRRCRRNFVRNAVRFRYTFVCCLDKMLPPSCPNSRAGRALASQQRPRRSDPLRSRRGARALSRREEKIPAPSINSSRRRSRRPHHLAPRHPPPPPPPPPRGSRLVSRARAPRDRITRRRTNRIELTRARVRDVGGEPVEAFVQTLAGRRARGLNEPMTLADAVKAELVRDLRGGHRVREILLVRENEQDGVAELILEAAEWGEGGGRRVRRRIRSDFIRSRARSLGSVLKVLKRDAARRRGAPRTSLSMRWSSSRASETRSRSLLSTTKIRPCVFWK